MTNLQTREFTMVLGVRQITLGLFMAVILLGSFSAMAYVVGRAVIPSESAEVEAPDVERVLVVDPAGQEEETAAPSPAAKPGSSEFSAESYFREPSPGQLFLQVAAADRGVAEVFAEYLTRKSFPCQIAPGPDERNYRILVGPIQGRQQLGTLRAGLETSGFNPFPRRYKAN